MKLIITSSEKNVIFQRRSQKAIFTKNQVDFEMHPAHISFKTTREEFSFNYEDIEVNKVMLTVSNAEELLSEALFRNASGGGGGNNWEQTDF